MKRATQAVATTSQSKRLHDRHNDCYLLAARGLFVKRLHFPPLIASFVLLDCLLAYSPVLSQPCICAPFDPDTLLPFVVCVSFHYRVPLHS